MRMGRLGKRRGCTPLLCLLLLVLPSLAQAKPRTRISDALDDVPDGEETEDWRSWGKRKEAKPITEPTPEVLRAGFKQLQLSIVSVDAELVKQRHGDMKTMLKRWGGWLHEGGVRGKHVTLEQAGASEEDVVVRYGDDADFDGPVLEFLMRQAEVTSALVRGQAVTKAQFLAAHPELEDEL